MNKHHFPVWSLGLRVAIGACAIFGVMAVGGCSAPPRGPAVPVALCDKATVMDDPAIRTWGDALNPAFMEEVMRAAAREPAARAARGEKGPLPTACYLGISGGGANGAYGAGVLCGWSTTGKRPEFKLVTGISTGALTAPFAFLGSDYDAKLTKVYTTVTTAEICKPRGMLEALFTDGMADTKPLRKLLQSLFDDAMMQAIAKAYSEGRIILVGTTNLDCCRGVIWNIGAIAASGKKDSLKVIHDILIASAAIPGAFPPVMIDVIADGKKFQEMHVDGGTRAQVFLYPPSLHLANAAAASGVVRDREAYIIRNARLYVDWTDVERLTLPIAGRAVGSLIDTQGVGDLYRIYLTAMRDKVGFNLAIIPQDFTLVPEQPFDPVYMSKLYDLGFKAATQQGGYPWQHVPPGFTVEEAAAATATIKSNDPAHDKH